MEKGKCAMENELNDEQGITPPTNNDLCGSVSQDVVEIIVKSGDRVILTYRAISI